MSRLRGLRLLFRHHCSVWRQTQINLTVVFSRLDFVGDLAVCGGDFVDTTWFGFPELFLDRLLDGFGRFREGDLSTNDFASGVDAIVARRVTLADLDVE